MSGADIAELRERRRVDALQGINSTLFARIERFPRPTVAAVAGHCLGGGMELALACDFRVAGASSRFGQPEVGLGIMAAAGGTRRLPALVGLAQARRLLFSAAVIGAGEALEIGLVDRVVPDGDVLAAADELLAAHPRPVRRGREAHEGGAPRLAARRARGGPPEARQRDAGASSSSTPTSSRAWTRSSPSAPRRPRRQGV